MRMQSSRVGSIADNSSGGSYAYRASKAALNSIGKSMAMDLKEKGVTVVMMHPGYVKTALDTSGHTHSLPEAVEPEEAASKLWKVLKSKKIEDTGTFWHREGAGIALVKAGESCSSRNIFKMHNADLLLGLTPSTRFWSS
jgi:NAD(P)-dependent dehydrogenase (short-subunit alcohol dehydrogenase family)